MYNTNILLTTNLKIDKILLVNHMKFLKNLKFTWKYSKKYKKNLIYFTLLNILQIIVFILQPIISAKLILNLTNNELYQLVLMAIAFLFIEILNDLFQYFKRYNNNIFSKESYAKMQYDLGKEILKINNSDLDKTSSGLFIQRLTNDASNLSDIFTQIIDNVTEIITDISIYVAIFLINKKVFLFLIVTLLLIYFVQRKRSTLRNENDKLFRKSKEQISGFIGELVRGARDIKMLNAEDNYTNELHNKVTTLNEQRYEMNKIDRNYIFYINSIFSVRDFLLIVLLSYLILINEISIPNALVLYNFSNNTSGLPNFIGRLLDIIKDFNLSVDRIKELLRNDIFKKESFGNRHLNKVKGTFEFKNVNFAYDKISVLNNLNFEVKANTSVAFVGKSGSGKTTIFNLLCKLYPVSSGTITIDGIDINELDKDSIRGNITIISQNPYIFNTTIKENLKLVKPDVTDKEIEEACKLACLDEYIMSLPDKYDTLVGEGGINLSGGQKQRLAIARAFIQKTEIILFDEATSALDNDTQEQIQKAINNLKGDYTILIIAHRFSTILNCDKIYVLDKGTVIAEGTHDQLIKKSKEYKKLYEKELKKNK